MKKGHVKRVMDKIAQINMVVSAAVDILNSLEAGKTYFHLN